MPLKALFLVPTVNGDNYTISDEFEIWSDISLTAALKHVKINLNL